MTTVAYRKGVMACDSCWSYNDAVDTLQTKIHRLKSGGLLGSSGDNDDRVFTELLGSIKDAKGLPTYQTLLGIRASFLGLLVLPDHTIVKISTTIAAPETWTEEDMPDLGIWTVNHEFTAIGSGTDFAIGAMEHGATAKEAVTIACRRDINSRPPVLTVKL